ncbi:MAG: hypothetical protein C0399_12980, partial [Syntrophus sp. (in: bacteria)]|nr:hypothetical protein [Syntrophus sp. (in: bacteria)]MBA4419309.1 hypothetical protein [Syntrophus sp. (in: bacteria)]
MTLPIKTPHDMACTLADKYSSTHELNEADTRHQVIDVTLHDILSWPRSAVHCESFIDPGYADYGLLGRQDKLFLLIEAKKEGKYFTFPANFGQQSLSSIIRMKTLLTDPTMRSAVEQVRTYCTNVGCEYAAVTNGHQWVFFKTFERQRDWRDLNAFVIFGLRYFCDCFTDATNKLGYADITDRASLVQLLGGIQSQRREVFYPKTGIVAYDQEVTSNHLAPFLRPLAGRYLGVMNERDDEFMERCYVNMREYTVNIAGVNQVIYDCLSPYFQNYNVKEFLDDSEGGAFGTRIVDGVCGRQKGEVIILFGGKGSGKSTFIRRLLYHRPPDVVKNFAVVAVVDLLECPEERTNIEKQIWIQLLNSIDQNNVLNGDREGIINLFADRYRQAQKQTLAGLDPKSEMYNIQLNGLIKEWLQDSEYCAVRIAEHWRTRQKGLIVVLDNTDQFSTDMQDYSFTLAQHISTRLKCLVVISMREERFHYSKLHGTLDAFPNSGFHLSSPPTEEVFSKRLAYMSDILASPDRTGAILPGVDHQKIQNIDRLLRVLRQQFQRGQSSHLDKFLRACAHGNMRLSLELFREFLLSGYTRVDEMIRRGGWTLKIHQVLRPMMVPYRFFYAEESSSIPNLFKIRSEISGSHFTALRILTLLSANMSPINPAYLPFSQLKAYFANNFNMMDD